MKFRQGRKCITMRSNFNNSRRFVKDSLPLLTAIFLAIASVVYVMYKSWSNKLDAERWKDYEDCGI